MELGVPAHFLSVVLTEERENHAASCMTTTCTSRQITTEDEQSSTVTTASLLPQPPLSQASSFSSIISSSQRSSKKTEDYKPIRNGFNDQEKWDLMKHFPKALLAECTVEIHSTPLHRPEKLQQRLCFDAKVSPVFAKSSDVIPTVVKKETKCLRYLKLNSNVNIKKLHPEEESQETGGDILELIEAVYSDHESDDEVEAEQEDIGTKFSNYTLPPDIDIKQESLNPAVSITAVSGTPKISFKCEHCPNVYPNRGALWQHSVATHSVEKTCECKICGRKFYRNCSLALHLKSHSEEEYCACKECGKSFTRLVNLERHMKVHSEGEQLQCEQCDKTFSDRTNLLRHAVCHISPSIRTHQCDVCGKSYKSQDHLEIHYQSAHAAISCSVCGKSFSTFAELTLHDATHTFEHRYLCRYCGKSFSQKAVLRKHLIIHTGERLKCNTCGIEFTQRSSLLRHVKRMHCSPGQTSITTMAQVVLDPVLSMDTDDNIDIKSDSTGVKEYEFEDYEDDIEEEEEMPLIETET